MEPRPAAADQPSLNSPPPAQEGSSQDGPSVRLPSSANLAARLKAQLDRIRHRDTGGRDLHLDLLRGWCIFSMVVDHAAGERQSLLFGVTGNGSWPVTGAHGFVMLSGTVMGVLYARAMPRLGTRGTLTRLGQRAFKLYLVAVALGLFDVLWTVVPVLGGGAAAVDWSAVLPIFTLTRGSDDLMTFYVLLVLLAAPVILLLRRGLWWLVLAASVGAWLLHQWNESWLNPPTVYFVPVADWQLLFVAGLVMGFHRPEIGAWLRGVRRTIFLALLMSVWGLLLVVQVVFNNGLLDSPAWLDRFAADAWQGYDHNPPAHMLTVFVYLLGLHRLTGWLWLPLERVLGWFLVPLGQSALYVYAVHAVLVFYVLQALPAFNALQGWSLTAALLGLMLLLWVLVKRRFLFWLIPR